jgi:hypothetical protein
MATTELEVLLELKVDIAELKAKQNNFEENYVKKEDFGNFKTKVTTYGSAAMLVGGFLMWALK